MQIVKARKKSSSIQEHEMELFMTKKLESNMKENTISI